MSIELIVNRLDGQLYLKNPTAVTQALDAYSIGSVSGAINSANWLSVTAFYDQSAGGLLDPNSDWFELSKTDNSLAEASLTTFSATMMPGQIVSLGQVWRVGEAEDLMGVIASGVTATPVEVDFRSLMGDYNFDLAIDDEDYLVFASTFGSTTDLRADGNFNGVVDAADYTIWRDSPEFDMASSQVVGDSPDGAPPVVLLSAPLSIPEPTGLLLALGALGAGLTQRGWQARRGWQV